MTEETPSPEHNLGESIQVFKPMMGNIFAGFIISLLLLAGSAALVGFPLRSAYRQDWNLPLSHEKDFSWLLVGLYCMLSFVVGVLGVLLAWYCRKLLFFRVEVYKNGFRCVSRGSTDDVRWADVTGIQETILYESPPILKGAAKHLLPKVASSSYLVMTASGEKFGFDGNSVKSIRRFGKLLREQADRLSLPWEVVEEYA
ncbi:hypothetical protein [Fimbriiglobus ruber]|nr:hypothetical protein [Fimbriiglobus ruber]